MMRITMISPFLSPDWTDDFVLHRLFFSLSFIYKDKDTRQDRTFTDASFSRVRKRRRQE